MKKQLKFFLFSIICGTVNIVLPTLIKKMHPAYQTVNFFYLIKNVRKIWAQTRVMH